MVEHWSEKPGVDSSILSLGISFCPHFILLAQVQSVSIPFPVQQLHLALQFSNLRFTFGAFL